MSRKNPTQRELAMLEFSCSYCKAQPGEWCHRWREPSAPVPACHVSRVEQENRAWMDARSVIQTGENP